MAFIESYIGREGVEERMKRDIEGFSRAKLEELKKVVAFIESYIGREGVKGVLQCQSGGAKKVGKNFGRTKNERKFNEIQFAK